MSEDDKLTPAEMSDSKTTTAVATTAPTKIQPQNKPLDNPMYQPREITLKSNNGSFGFHLKGPLKSGNPMRHLNGQLYPPLCYIYSMDEYSSAIKAGLKIYDTILEINGVDVGGLSCESVLELVNESLVDGHIKLKVMYPDDISTVKEFGDSPSTKHDFGSYVENMTHLLKSLSRNPSATRSPQSVEMLHKVNLNELLEKEKKVDSTNQAGRYLPSIKQHESNHYSDDNLENIICIPVIRFIKCVGKERAFYDIYQGDRFLVSRRFNDFRAYDKHMRTLVDEFPTLPTSWSLFMDNTQLDARRMELENYLKKVTHSLIILKLAPTRLFLGLGTAKYNECILPLCDPYKKSSSDDDSDSEDGSVSSIDKSRRHSVSSAIATSGSVDAIFSSYDSLNLPSFEQCDKKSTKFLISIALADYSLRLPLIVHKSQTVMGILREMCIQFNFPIEFMKHFALFHCPTTSHGGIILRKKCLPFQIFLQNYIEHHHYSLCIKRWQIETETEKIFLRVPVLVNILYSQLCYDIKYGNMDERESAFVVRPPSPDVTTKIKILKTARNFSSYATFRINIDSFSLNDLVYKNCVIILSPFSARICLDSDNDRTTIFSFNINDVGKPKIIECKCPTQQSLQLDVNDVHQYKVVLVSSNLGYLLRCLKKVFKARERMSVISTPNQHPV